MAARRVRGAGQQRATFTEAHEPDKSSYFVRMPQPSTFRTARPACRSEYLSPGAPEGGAQTHKNGSAGGGLFLVEGKPHTTTMERLRERVPTPAHQTWQSGRDPDRGTSGDSQKRQDSKPTQGCQKSAARPADPSGEIKIGNGHENPHLGCSERVHRDRFTRQNSGKHLKSAWPSGLGWSCPNNRRQCRRLPHKRQQPAFLTTNSKDPERWPNPLLP